MNESILRPTARLYGVPDDLLPPKPAKMSDAEIDRCCAVLVGIWEERRLSDEEIYSHAGISKESYLAILKRGNADLKTIPVRRRELVGAR